MKKEMNLKAVKAVNNSLISGNELSSVKLDLCQFNDEDTVQEMKDKSYSLSFSTDGNEIVVSLAKGGNIVSSFNSLTDFVNTLNPQHKEGKKQMVFLDSVLKENAAFAKEILSTLPNNEIVFFDDSNDYYDENVPTVTVYTTSFELVEIHVKKVQFDQKKNSIFFYTDDLDNPNEIVKTWDCAGTSENNIYMAVWDYAQYNELLNN